jgi:hypothetical protein
VVGIANFSNAIVYLVKLSSGVFQMCFYQDWRKSQTLEFPDLVTNISATDIGTEGGWEGSKVTGRFSSTSPVRFTSVVDADADSKPWLSRVGTGWMLVDEITFAVFNIFRDNGRPLYLNEGDLPQSQYYAMFVSLLIAP